FMPALVPPPAMCVCAVAAGETRFTQAFAPAPPSGPLFVGTSPTEHANSGARSAVRITGQDDICNTGVHARRSAPRAPRRSWRAGAGIRRRVSARFGRARGGHGECAPQPEEEPPSGATAAVRVLRT